jgi:predicted TIM-barrel fold metal-dependent hydrolase
MEDERTHHPLCKIPSLSVPSIVEVARRFSGLAVVALCPLYHEAVELAKGPANLRFDLAYVERMRTVPSLLAEVPEERVLFGSHTPFLQTRAAVMKTRAPSVPRDARRAIESGNARAILGRALRAGPRRVSAHQSLKE